MKFASVFNVLHCAGVITAAGLVSIPTFGDEGWKNSSQAGLVTTSGNTETKSLSVGETLSYAFDSNVLRGTGAYLYQKSGEVVSGENWSFGLRYEKVLDVRFSVFAGETVEGNRFAGINQRYSSDLGGKVAWVKDESFLWATELGYRYTRENLIALRRNLHYARLFNELEKKIGPSVSGRFWVEYLPNFTSSTNWQLNSEASLSAAVSSIFSVKSAYLVKYDHEVNAAGLKTTDTTVTTSLVAQF